MHDLEYIMSRADTPRVADLRQRVRDAMDRPAADWKCPERIDHGLMDLPLAVRKAHAIALKLRHMPPDHWEGQLFAGSMTLEDPRIHAEWGFPDYLTEFETVAARKKDMSIYSVFGHIVPDYAKLLSRGLADIRDEAESSYKRTTNDDKRSFFKSVIISAEGVIAYAERLAGHLADNKDPESARLSGILRCVPAYPARTFREALQSVWLLHMIFHSTVNGNALGRADQYLRPYLEKDLSEGRLNLEQAAELVDCFCLKFNERARTNEEQMPENRASENLDLSSRTRHYTSSQLGTGRDRLDAANHWLQNIIIGGLTPSGKDSTNPLSFLFLESYRRNRMTNPLMTVRVHRGSPDTLIAHACRVIREGGGMPALFNDEIIIPALTKLGIPLRDARDYTNDGCWEVIIPGRTDFRFQRISLLLCLEWALNRGRSVLDGSQQGPDTGDPAGFRSFKDVWKAFRTQMEAMIGSLAERVIERLNDREPVAPVPLLSSLIEGTMEKGRDMTGGGAKFRTFGMLAESAAHAIDSLTAIKTVIFEQKKAGMNELLSALRSDYDGHEKLRKLLLLAPKYGNNDPEADAMGRKVMDGYAAIVQKKARQAGNTVRFPCGVATFSWYIGIGEGLAASPDGRRAHQPVSSNFSPALGRDMSGLPPAILSYSGMPHDRLPAGGPLDLRVNRKLVEGSEGLRRMKGLVRTFVDLKGSMMTLTVADTEELRAARERPDEYRSLRVRMGGWCAYFTMLSREQQDHHIRRQEGPSP